MSNDLWGWIIVGISFLSLGISVMSLSVVRKNNKSNVDIATAVNSISSSGLRVVTKSDMLEVIHQANLDSPTPQSDESTN